MQNSLQGWLSGRAGSVSMTSGFVFVLMAVGVGGALDFSNAVNRRADLQRSADAAALAGAARPDMEMASVKELALSALGDTSLIGRPVAVAERATDGIVTVSIDAVSATSLLGIVGWNGVEVGATSAAAFVPASNGKIEVALVLDTTQSMADDMVSLRTSAQELASTLFDTGGENVKISVVPYVASVNVGNGSTQRAWTDTAGTAPYHGYAHEWQRISYCIPSTTTPTSSSGGTSSPPACTAACGCPGEMACGGGDDGASLFGLSGVRFAGSLLNELLGASNATATPVPYATPDPAICPIDTPGDINYYDLLDAIPNAEWGGCVEARPAPHDVTDTGPDSDGSNSRFVPYFWPDEGDWLGAETWGNNYIDDLNGPTVDAAVQYLPTWSKARRVNVWKYNDTPGDIDASTSDVSGPNRACPDPMLPLTNDAGAVSSKISSLTHRDGGGTITSEGLMWGWRALSADAPFSEGVPYDDETRKIIIIMSDGANAVIARNDASGQPADETMGDYTAYGFAHEFDQNWPSRGLIDTTVNTSTAYFDQIRDFLNDRTAEACTNVKAAGTSDNPVEIFTVLVGDSDASTEEVMANCATTRSSHYKEVSQMSVLQEAFGEIAKEIASEGTSRLVH